jgi:hypothetical protein
MHWKSSRLTIKRWEANGLRITEMMELDGLPFTLQSLADPDQEPMGFSTLRAAQAYAEVLHELTVVRQDNDRLRTELSQARGTWTAPAAVADETTPDRPDEMPADSSAARAASAELVQAMVAAPAAPGANPSGTAARATARQARQAARVDDGGGIPIKVLAIAECGDAQPDPWF